MTEPNTNINITWCVWRRTRHVWPYSGEGPKLRCRRKWKCKLARYTKLLLIVPCDLLHLFECYIYIFCIFEAINGQSTERLHKYSQHVMYAICIFVKLGATNTYNTLPVPCVFQRNHATEDHPRLQTGLTLYPATAGMGSTGIGSAFANVYICTLKLYTDYVKYCVWS